MIHGLFKHIASILMCVLEQDAIASRRDGEREGASDPFYPASNSTPTKTLAFVPFTLPEIVPKHISDM